MGAPVHRSLRGRLGRSAWWFGLPLAWGQCTANEFAKLTASDGAPSDWFGVSVAVFEDIAVPPFRPTGRTGTTMSWPAEFCKAETSWFTPTSLLGTTAMKHSGRCLPGAAPSSPNAWDDRQGRCDVGPYVPRATV